MRKLFLIPLLTLFMGLSFAVLNTTSAQAHDFHRHLDDDWDDRHDRDDWDDDDRDDWDDYRDDWDDDDYDRDDRRGHRWDRQHRGHANVHYHINNGHRVRCHLDHNRHRHHRYDRRHIDHRNYHDRYRYDRDDYVNRGRFDAHGRTSLNAIFTGLGFTFD